MNIDNISDNFNKCKPILLELLISYYGEEHRNKITERFNSIYFDFSSTPDEDYKYALSHNLSDFEQIKKRFEDYERIKNKAKKIYRKLILKYIYKNFIQSYNIPKDKENLFISLFFDDEFNTGYIDSFSSESIELVNNPHTPIIVKQSIVDEQKRFMEISSELKLHYKNISLDLINKFINFRNIVQSAYETYIIKNSEFGKKIYKTIKREFNLKISPADITTFAFNEEPQFIALEDYHFNNCRYIKYPITAIINCTSYGIDISIIHELIHAIENDGKNVGIRIYKDSNLNNVANEIRTEKIAKKLTKKLHEKGIFIYDNPEDYQYEETSCYEWLFGFCSNFFEQFESFISNLAINGTPFKLDEQFGESWKTYSKHLDNIYYKLVSYITIKPGVDIPFKFPDIHTELIEDMKDFYNNKKRINLVKKQ